MPIKLNMSFKYSAAPGTRYGRWTIKAEIDRGPVPGNEPERRRRLVLCVCDCGTERIRGIQAIACKNPSSRSCGCYQREQTASRLTTHGGFGSGEYNIWLKMRGRCSDPTDPSFHRYGGRGITVYAPWHNSFPDFLAAIGKRPSASYTLDRINNDGNYEPGNVRWATRREQARNRANTQWVAYKGASRKLIDVCEELGVPGSIAIGRRHRGWPDEALFMPPKTRLVSISSSIRSPV